MTDELPAAPHEFLEAVLEEHEDSRPEDEQQGVRHEGGTGECANSEDDGGSEAVTHSDTGSVKRDSHGVDPGTRHMNRGVKPEGLKGT